MNNAVFNSSQQPESESSGTETTENMKGANPRRRSVLGRGLGALMSPSLVSVDPLLTPAASIAASSAAAQTSPHSAPVSPAQNSNIGPASASSSIGSPTGSASNATPVQPSTASFSPSAAAPGHSPADHIERQNSGREDVEGVLLYLPIEQVFPNPTQPRKDFKPEEIDSLSQSIRETGMLQPILVRKRKLDRSGINTSGLPYSGYEIVAGERRWRAATMAGLNKVPAIVKHLTDRQTLELSIVENIQREELNPVEEAHAYQRLMNEFGATQEEIAQSVGRDRASISNAIRLLKLPEEIRTLLVSGRISAGHGRALLVLSAADEQKALVDRILGEGLSVRAVEQAVSGKGKMRRNGHTAKQTGEPEVVDHNVTALENRLRDRLGTKVKLSLNRSGAGELKITFFSDSELQSLLEKIGA